MTLPTEQNKLPLLVTAAIIIEQGRVLITRRPARKPHGGLWEFPGGKINPGESPVEALQRELQEELALDICVEQVFDVLFYRYDWGPVLILAYTCTRNGGTPRNLEVSEHRWVTPADLSQFELLAADQPLIAKLLEPT